MSPRTVFTPPASVASWKVRTWPPPLLLAMWSARSALLTRSALSKESEGNDATPTLTDSRSVRDSLSPGMQVPLEPLDDALRQGLRPFRVPFQQEDAEFVPAEARHRVDLPHGAAQDAGELLQGDVARGLAEPVVVRLESVQVERQEAERLPVAAGAEDLLFQLMVEVFPVVEVRQRIEEGVDGEGVPGIGAMQVGFGLERQGPRGASPARG